MSLSGNLSEIISEIQLFHRSPENELEKAMSFELVHTKPFSSPLKNVEFNDAAEFCSMHLSSGIIFNNLFLP